MRHSRLYIAFTRVIRLKLTNDVTFPRLVHCPRKCGGYFVPRLEVEQSKWVKVRVTNRVT